MNKQKFEGLCYEFPEEEMESRQVLDRYLYPKDEDIIKHVKGCNFQNESESAAVVNEIVLWKLNRQVEIDNRLLERIKALKCSRKYFKNRTQEEQKEIESILNELLNSVGVKIAMASTILKMFHPDIFPIIDRRAYHCMWIYKKRIKESANSQPEDSESELKEYWGKKKNIEIYLQYMDDCYEYFYDVLQEKIEFQKVDQILYQIDKDAGHRLK